MILSQRQVNSHTGGWYVGPGGRRCVCCGIAPRDTKKARRTARRVEKREWRNGIW